jgi:hypothetical protein
MRGIATVDTMAKPWSSTTFEYRDGLSGAGDYQGPEPVPQFGWKRPQKAMCSGESD